MPILALLALAASPAAPACRPAQLRLSAEAHDGDYNGMSHAGTELSLRNLGADCTLPALPVLRFVDARGRPLAAARQVPPGLHPGPVMVPLRLAGGHRAATALRWVSGPVFPRNRALRAAAVTVAVGAATLRAPLSTTLYAPAGAAARFEQPPLRAMEGMAAG